MQKFIPLGVGLLSVALLVYWWKSQQQQQQSVQNVFRPYDGHDIRGPWEVTGPYHGNVGQNIQQAFGAQPHQQQQQQQQQQGGGGGGWMGFGSNGQNGGNWNGPMGTGSGASGGGAGTSGNWWQNAANSFVPNYGRNNYANGAWSGAGAGAGGSGGGAANFNLNFFANGQPFYLIASNQNSATPQSASLTNCPASQCKVVVSNPNGGTSSQTTPPYPVATSFALTQTNFNASNNNGGGVVTCTQYSYAQAQTGPNGYVVPGRYRLITTDAVNWNSANVNVFSTGAGGLKVTEQIFTILSTGIVPPNPYSQNVPLSLQSRWVLVSIGASRTGTRPSVWLLSTAKSLTPDQLNQLNQIIQSGYKFGNLRLVDPNCAALYQLYPFNGNGGNGNGGGYGGGYGGGGYRDDKAYAPNAAAAGSFTSPQYWAQQGQALGQNLANQAGSTVQGLTNQGTGYIQGALNSAGQAGSGAASTASGIGAGAYAPGKPLNVAWNTPAGVGGFGIGQQPSGTGPWQGYGSAQWQQQQQPGVVAPQTVYARTQDVQTENSERTESL